MRSLVHALLFVVLALWVAALIAPGAAAMSAFTRLPEVRASVPGYDAFFADDPDGMGRLVAGFVTNPIFRVTDAVQLVLAPLALALLAFAARLGNARLPFAVAGLALVLATAHVAWHGFVVGPRMQTHLEGYRAAAERDDQAGATRELAAFDGDHESTERLFGARLLLILVGGACASAAAATPRSARAPESRS